MNFRYASKLHKDEFLYDSEKIVSLVCKKTII